MTIQQKNNWVSTINILKDLNIKTPISITDINEEGIPLYKLSPLNIKNLDNLEEKIPPINIDDLKFDIPELYIHLKKLDFTLIKQSKNIDKDIMEYYEFCDKNNIWVRVYTSERVLIFKIDNTNDFPSYSILFDGYFTDPRIFDYMFTLIKPKPKPY